MNLPYFMFVSYDHARMLDWILRRYEYNIVAMDHDKRTLILIKPGVDIYFPAPVNMKIRIGIYILPQQPCKFINISLRLTWKMCIQLVTQFLHSRHQRFQEPLMYLQFPDDTQAVHL